MTGATVPVGDRATATATAGPVGGLGRTVARIATSELRLLLRETGVLVGMLAFPAVTVLILAGVFGSAPDPEFGGVRPSEHYVVGYLGVVLAHVGLVTLPVHLASNRELGVSRRYRASGVSGTAQVLVAVAVGVALSVLGGLVVLAVGGAVYGLPAPAHPLAVAGWTVAGVGCFVALGVALGSLLPTSRAATSIGNLVFVPMFLLGGGGPPRAVMTDVMRTVSDVLPSSHVIGGIRQGWLGHTEDPRALWWTALVAVVAVTLAVRATRRRAG